MKPTALPQPKYEPTPAEIRQACAEIQAGWTAEQEMKHGGMNHQPVEIRETRIEVEL